LFRPIYEEIEAKTRAQAEAMRLHSEDAVSRSSVSGEWRNASGYVYALITARTEGRDG
jgi:hypothetical protein